MAAMADRQDRFEDHLKLAEFYMEVRKDRRQHEWRVSLGLWAGLAAGIVAAANKDTPPIPWWLLAVLLLAVIFVHACLWIPSNEARNNRDAKKAYRHIKEAERLLGGPTDERTDEPCIYGTTAFELLATVLLSLALFTVYYASHMPTH